MKGFHMVKNLVKPYDWLAKIDLKDAYSSTHGPKSLQIPPVSVATYKIPVLVSPIRPFLCSSNLYKADETSGGFPQGEGNPVDNISGRSAKL